MPAKFCGLALSVVLLVAASGACAPGEAPLPAASPVPSSATLPPPTQPPATAPPTDTAPPPTPAPPDHRIGVRVVGGIGEFYDRETGEKFVPRGNNYIRLADQQTASGETILFHSTFNPGLYDPALSKQALSRMHSDGYNTVRLLLNNCCRSGSLGDPAGGLSAAYMDNVVDFLRLAKAHDIYVLVTTSLPAVGGYIELLDTTWSEDFAGNSSVYLRPGGILATAQLWLDFIQALVARDAPLDAILAYQLENEVFFESNLPPFSLSSGLVATANGQTYDLASGQDKQRMMDEGLVFWIDALRREILRVDPSALVTVGFFWPQQPHPSRIGDPRVIETRPAIWESSADFLDLHSYPGGDLTLPQYVDNFGMAGMEEKPIIMGEFGAARSAYANAAATARALHDWQVESCDYGFDGWLLWTWDGEEQTDFYNGLGDGGLINQALAPASRPDPCQPGSFAFFEHNLALGKTPRASRSLPESPPSNAVNGTTEDWWGAGGPPIQWIEIDLGEPSAVRLIRLVVSQSPPGDTLHQLWVGSAPGELYLLHTFEGYTSDLQVLEFSPEAPIENVRYLQVVTRGSPSWVGWREIEVLAP